MAIISASRRTDIPAFYALWFMNRIRDGFLFVQNPFNSDNFFKIDLSPQKVEVIVFWTKNPQPMLTYLDELNKRGYRYYFHFTLTGYPRILEPSVPPLEARLNIFKELSKKIGANKVIWRFDPIILSNITNEDFILRTFETLSKELKHYTRRVVISFADFYKKVIANLRKIEKEGPIKFYNINMDQVVKLSSYLSEIATKNAMQIFSCAEKYDLSKFGVNHGKCIDDNLIKELFGVALNLQKDKYQRKECGCVQSQDIGQYNSCIYNCVYCYANYNKKIAHNQHSLHDPDSPFLIGNRNISQAFEEEKKDQLGLFRIS